MPAALAARGGVPSAAAAAGEARASAWRGAQPRSIAAAAASSSRGAASSSARRATVTVVPSSSAPESSGSGVGAPHPDPAKPLYPGVQEERDVSHEAFMHAFEAARPRAMQIPGMQEFAASVYSRSRIPSQSYVDPLDHIFSEFDQDNDGRLSAREIADALVSRGVAATEEQVQMFIEASDDDNDHLVSRSEWRPFIFRMASADLRSATSFAAPRAPPPPVEQQRAPRIILPPGMGGDGPGAAAGGQQQ